MRSRSAPRSGLRRNDPVGSRKTSCGCGVSCCATLPGCVRLKWKDCKAVWSFLIGSSNVETAAPSLGMLVLFLFFVCSRVGGGFLLVRDREELPLIRFVYHAVHAAADGLDDCTFV